MARLRAVIARHPPGLRRDTLTGPPLGGNGKGVLGGFLGEVEVAEEAHQGRQHPPPLVAEDLLEQPLHLRQRTHLDRTAEAGSRDPGSQLDGGVVCGRPSNR